MRTSSLRTRGSWEVITRSDAKRRGLTVEPLAPVYREKDLGMVLDRSVWFEACLGPRWKVAFRLANQRGQPVIAEARIFPDEPERYPVGQWSGEYGAPATVPPGGLTARILRTIRTQAFRHDLRTITSRWTEKLKDLMPELRVAVHSQSPPVPTRGRKGRTDRELARIAAAYERAYLAGRPAIAAIAEAFKFSLSKARDAVRRARTRGLLSGGGKQGKGGGLLTPDARALLKQDGKRSQTKGGKRGTKR